MGFCFRLSIICSSELTEWFLGKFIKYVYVKFLGNKLLLKKDLFKIKVEENGDLSKYFNKFYWLIIQLIFLDEIFKTEDKVLMFLVFLSKEYNTVKFFLLVGKIILDFDEIILVFFEVDNLMKQDSWSFFGDVGVLLMISDNKRRGKKKYNFKTCFYCDEREYI